MTTQKTNMLLISMPIYGVKKDDQGRPEIHHCSIINFGERTGQKNDRIKYLTKAGEQVEDITEVSNGGRFWVGSLDEISLPNLMHSWMKENNCYFTPFEIDEDIEQGEIVSNKCSPVKFMVQRLDHVVKIKPLFD